MVCILVQPMSTLGRAPDKVRLEVEPDWTVNDVLRQIGMKQIFKSPWSIQRGVLFFEGMELEGRRKLREYNICKDSTVEARLVGG